MNLLEKYVDGWHDGDGNLVEFMPFFQRLYQDEESKRISKEYDICACNEMAGFLKLGKSQHESFIGELLGIYSLVNKVVGFEVDDLKACDKRHGAFCSSEGDVFRKKKVFGREIYFLTEKFLRDTVKIPKRDF